MHAIGQRFACTFECSPTVCLIVSRFNEGHKLAALQSTTQNHIVLGLRILLIDESIKLNETSKKDLHMPVDETEIFIVGSRKLYGSRNYSLCGIIAHFRFRKRRKHCTSVSSMFGFISSTYLLCQPPRCEPLDSHHTELFHAAQ